MTDDLIARAEAALEGVSEGPWEAMCYCDSPGDEGCSILAKASDFLLRHGIAYTGLGYPWISEDQATADASFIAAARTLVPELVAELKATRLFRRKITEALGLVEIVDGVGEVVIGSDGDLLDSLRHFADTARDHVNCPVWCDDCEHFEQPDSCGRCSGSGCGPGTASGAYDPCSDCDGDGRDHDFAYVHAPDLEAELKATRVQLERVTRLAEKLGRQMVQAAVWMKPQYQDAGLVVARIFCNANGIDVDALEYEARQRAAVKAEQ